MMSSRTLAVAFMIILLFFFNDTATTEIYTLSLHDALPICSAISPSLWLRQLRSRYAIRAGRNLPDKEFRYLRMVIVTTAVYWRLSSELHPHGCGLTRPLNVPAPGRRQSVYIVLRLRTDLCF